MRWVCAGRAPTAPPWLARLRWLVIAGQRLALVLYDREAGEVDKTARVLGLHRRTLQYKLSKFPQSR